MTEAAPRVELGVVLSGGFGTRLRPLTLSTPKAVLPVLNKPFCLYPLEWLRRHGVKRVVLAAGYRSQILERVIRSGKPRALAVTLKTEPKPLGTGGALRFAAGGARDPVFALNGDILTDFDLSAMRRLHFKRGALATLALVRVPDASRYGSVALRADGSIARFTEKRPGRRPGWVNAGVYLLGPEALRAIPRRSPCSLERDVFPGLARTGRLFGHPLRGYWKDVGTFPSYFESHRDLLRRAGRKSPLIGRGSRIGRGTVFTGTVSIGPNCRIGSGVRLRNAILLDGVRVGDGARIDGAILSSRCRIGARARLGPGTVLGRAARVPDFGRPNATGFPL